MMKSTLVTLTIALLALPTVGYAYSRHRPSRLDLETRTENISYHARRIVSLPEPKQEELMTKIRKATSKIEIKLHPALGYIRYTTPENEKITVAISHLFRGAEQDYAALTWLKMPKTLGTPPKIENGYLGFSSGSPVDLGPHYQLSLKTIEVGGKGTAYFEILHDGRVVSLQTITPKTSR